MCMPLIDIFLNKTIIIWLDLGAAILYDLSSRDSFEVKEPTVHTLLPVYRWRKPVHMQGEIQAQQWTQCIVLAIDICGI